LDPEKQKNSLAWAIAMKISKQGTEIFSFPNGSGLLTNVITAQRITAFAKTFAEVKSAEIFGQIKDLLIKE